MAGVVQFSFIHAADSPELAGDIQALFDDLAASLPHDLRARSGEYRPPVDVLDTDAAATVHIDVAGVPAEALRVLFRANVLLVVGEKAPLRGAPDHTYHLLEREFGRFARAVRLNGAFDVDQATATLRQGELMVVLPRTVERRGAAHPIPVTSSRGHSG